MCCIMQRRVCSEQGKPPQDPLQNGMQWWQGWRQLEKLGRRPTCCSLRANSEQVSDERETRALCTVQDHLQQTAVIAQSRSQEMEAFTTARARQEEAKRINIKGT